MFCWGHSSDPSPLSVGLLLHTHTTWVCAVGGPGLFTLSLNPPGAISVPCPPFFTFHLSQGLWERPESLGLVSFFCLG